MRWMRHAIGSLLLVFVTTGCWSSTQSLTPGDARAGEAGYGMAEHAHVFYAVFAASVVRYYGAGQVAMADEGDVDLPDSVWQSYDGGRRVRHCFVVNGQHVCRDAELHNDDDSLGWPTSLVFVDPANLGRFIQTVEYADDDTYVFVRTGGVYDGSDNRSRIGPNHGVWGVVAGDKAIVHCQLEGGTTPMCRAVPEDLGGGLHPNVLSPVLGVFPSPQENILWIAKPDGVFRCTATAARPQPDCVMARMQ